MEPQPPLHRSAGLVMLNAVADEGLQPPVVHSHRDLDADLSQGSQQELLLRSPQIQNSGGLFKIALGRAAHRFHPEGACSRLEIIGDREPRGNSAPEVPKTIRFVSAVCSCSLSLRQRDRVTGL